MNPALRIRPSGCGRGWALVAVLVSWSIMEALLRQDLAWRPVVLTAGVVVALTLPRPRPHHPWSRSRSAG